LIGENTSETRSKKVAYLISVMVAGRTFDGRGEVEDDFVIGRSFPPGFENPISKFNRKFGFGLGKSL
jgi:hypothetical protein